LTRAMEEREPPLFAAPVKHSVTIEGHQTSVSLEPVFWAALRRAAREEGLAVNAVVALIDTQRVTGFPASLSSTHLPANLASAIRCWLWERYCK
jgi:predicted DNA-binding ribbon-helix-helix protein